MTTVPTPTPASPVEEAARIGAFARMAGALFNPRETFADIARKPSWLVPIILYCILGLAVTAIFTKRVGWENFMRQQFEQSPQWSQLSADQQRTRITQAARFAPISGAVGVVLVYVVGTLILAAVLMGAFRVVSGSDVGFKASLGIVSHAYMPLAISGLLGILILFLKDPESVDLENLVGSNVAAFLESDAPKWLRALGSSLDLFSFWVIGLLATGFSTASPKKVRLGGALGTVIGLWLIYVLARTGLAAAFS